MDALGCRSKLVWSSSLLPTMTSLTKEECQRLLSRYYLALTSRVKRDADGSKAREIVEMDTWRLKELSEVVRQRKPAYMTKDELELLLHCKLYSICLLF